MGFLKKLGNALNPVKQTKQAVTDPKQSIKEHAYLASDPAGYAARAGTGKLDEPLTARYWMGSAGALAVPQEQAPIVAPNTYAPGRGMTLSPGAQALMDDIKARAAARTAGTPYTPATPAASPGYRPTPGGGVQPIMQVGQTPAPKPQPYTPAMSAPLTAPQPAAAPAAPVAQARPRSFSGLMMADGGAVGGKRPGLVEGYDHYESKVHTPKPRKR